MCSLPPTALGLWRRGLSASPQSHPSPAHGLMLTPGSCSLAPGRYLQPSLPPWGTGGPRGQCQGLSPARAMASLQALLPRPPLHSNTCVTGRGALGHSPRLQHPGAPLSTRSRAGRGETSEFHPNYSTVPSAAAFCNNPVPSPHQPQHPGRVGGSLAWVAPWQRDPGTPQSSLSNTLVLAADKGGNKTEGRAQGQTEGHTDGQTSEVYSSFCSASALVPREGAES